MNPWPDGGYTPFRNEKNNWEGATRSWIKYCRSRRAVNGVRKRGRLDLPSVSQAHPTKVPPAPRRVAVADVVKVSR
jgi:hypothetical protein